MHDVLAFASLFIGESGTMATECAVLGVPNIQVRHEIDHNKVPGVHVDLVHRGLKLLYLNTDIDGMISKSLELIDNPSIREQMRFARQNMLEEMIDVTGFLCWFVQNFPQSIEQMRKGKDVFRPFRLVNRNLPESFVPKLET
jgi:predicted glycosyltransferase